jgi:CelD/BcsL family acetyltransferase involved in cellulose biosynthesis
MANVMAAPSVTDSLADLDSGVLLGTEGGALRLSEVTDPNDFERLRPQWDAVIQCDPKATMFQTWDWQYTWWRHFGRGKKPFILLMSDNVDGAPCAIAPLILKPYASRPLRELAFMGLGVSDYLDITCLPGQREEAVARMFEHIESSAGAWDIVDLHQVRAGILVNRAGLRETAVFRREVVDHEVCPVVDLPASWDEYKATLGKSLRFNIGYYERSLRKQYDVEIGLATAENLDAEMDSLFRLHTQRWRSRKLPGVLSGKRIQAFHREAAGRFMDRGWLRLYYLKLNGVTRASLYCFAFGDSVYYYLGGFDPELSKYGPGTILTGRAIRDAIEDGRSRFDLLRGCEDYKLRWKPELRMNSRILIQKPGLRSGLARGMHGVEMCVEHAYKKRMNQTPDPGLIVLGSVRTDNESA